MDGLVLTAAGSSTRFGGETSKVLLDLAGKPVLVRALAPFRTVVPDLAVVITARPADVDAFQALVPDATIVTGGRTRQASVALGMDALPAGVETIYVHDGARPLVSRAVIERVRDAVDSDGAAAAVLPVRDTLHRLEAGTSSWPTLGPGVDRSDLARAQTPQAARAPLLRRAFEAAAAAGFEGTDEVSLLAHAGIRVVAVPGTLINIKITEPEDLELARAMHEQRSR